MHSFVANYVCMSNFQLCYTPSTYLQISVTFFVINFYCLLFSLPHTWVRRRRYTVWLCQTATPSLEREQQYSSSDERWSLSSPWQQAPPLVPQQVRGPHSLSPWLVSGISFEAVGDRLRPEGLSRYSHCFRGWYSLHREDCGSGSCSVWRVRGRQWPAYQLQAKMNKEREQQLQRSSWRPGFYIV